MRREHAGLPHRDHHTPSRIPGRSALIPFTAACALLLAASQAAPVTWTNTGSPTVDESSISLNGLFVHAAKWGIGSSSVTVGGETIFFAAGPSANLAPPNPGTANAIASASGQGQNLGLFVAPGAIDASFNTTLNGGAWDGPNPKQLVLNNLKVGASYQVQIFVSDDRSCCSSRTQKWSDAATSGAGNETTTFTHGSSTNVIGTFTATATTQTIYGLVTSPQTANMVNAYILREIVGADADSDGLPDYWERLYTDPQSDTALAPGVDLDGDGLNNSVEYVKHTSPIDGDSDDDGLNDGDELNLYHTDPLLADTDSDGLDDDVEVLTHHTDPQKPDSDNDGFLDLVEVNAVPPTNPNSNTSNPAGVLAEKRGLNNLVGGDLTDPENNGNSSAPNEATGLNFNWSAIAASSNGTFAGEGAYNVFDNAVGVSGSKWLGTLNTTTPPWLRTTFPAMTSLSRVTITSGNDAPDRDPKIWELQGSNDGTTWTRLFRWEYGVPWAIGERNHTYSLTFPKKTYPYRQIRFQIFGTFSGTTSGLTFQLDELEYIGESSDADTDADGIPDLIEDQYAFLNRADGNDGYLDKDNDGLPNNQEYEIGTKLDVADTDGDGLKDGEELSLAYDTNPLVADSDADGLSDGQEALPGGYGTNPKVADSDNDGFTDGQEVNSTPPTNPLDGNSVPYRVSILGIGTAALLKHDLTDPEDDINDNVGGSTTAGNAGSGANWVNIYSDSGRKYFNGSSQTSGNNEGLYNLFDNKVGGGEAKWCCEAAAKYFTIEFAAPISLGYFTMASGNDALDRSPTEWVLAGSNDNVNFTTIVADTSPGTHFWKDFNQVIRIDLNAPAPPYKFIRFTVNNSIATAPVAKAIQFSEMEFFAAGQRELPVISEGFNLSQQFEVTVGNLDTALQYQLYRSTTLLGGSWTAVGSPFIPATGTATFTDPAPPATKAFYKVQDVPATP